MLDFPAWGELSKSAACDWAFIAPDMHPVQHQASWYIIHPCQTQELMRLLLCESTTANRREDTVCHRGHRCESELDVVIPAIDDLVATATAFQGGSQPLGDGGGHSLPEDSSDEELALYMEAWLRLVGPVMGMKLPPPQH